MHDHAEQPALSRATLDRRPEERESRDVLTTARADAATRVLVIHGDAAPLAPRSAAPATHARALAAATVALHFVAPADVGAGAEWAFLGRQDDGAAVLVAAFPEDAAEPLAVPDGWGRLRAIGGELGAGDVGIFVEALSLGRWLVDAPYCPACGSLTELRQGGWSRSCPSCGREHFPRTDPAVIVAVESSDGERLLLGSNALWGGNRYSCFAGFVEAGESLEATVAREVREESGVRTTHVRYRGSQAWPYPRSLMLGFHATAIADDEAEADGTEILQVRWFTRDELGAALGGGGDVALPGTASIAHALIRDWHAAAPSSGAPE